MKKNFVLRIDEDMYKLLEKWAQDEFRSVNGQVEYIIHKALVEANRKKKKDVAKENQTKIEDNS